MKPEDLEAAFAMVRELHSKPLATRLKVGSKAWPKMRRRLAEGPTNGQIGLFGIPVHVIDNPNDWPPNLVAILDQEGNAMSAWIIND